jgi:hypothetical protein
MNTIIGKCEILKDKIGQSYLAVDIGEEQYSSFAQFMLSNNFHQDVERKLTRDKGCYHVTLINAAQWGDLTKRELADEVLQSLNGKELSFICHGIGRAEKEGHNAHFVILENQEINQFRAKYNLKPHDFHMTLAFNEKDVHGVPKNKETCVYPVEDIMKAIAFLNINQITQDQVKPANKLSI